MGATHRKGCEAGGLHPPYNDAVVAVRGINRRTLLDAQRREGCTHQAMNLRGERVISILIEAAGVDDVGVGVEATSL